MLTRLTTFLLILPIFYCEPVGMQTREKMVDHLDSIAQVFETAYAPADFKREYFGWTMQAALANAKSDVMEIADLDLKQYQQIVLRLLKSPQDVHVNGSFFSTERATLPFRILSAEGKYYISAIDNTCASARELKIGDEVISFDDQPIDAIIQNYLHATGTSDSKTDHTFAENALTFRAAAVGEQVPKGPVTLQILSQGKIKQVSFEWDYKKESISSPQILSKAVIQEKREKLKTSSFRFGKDIEKVYTPYKTRREIVQSIYEDLGYKESKIPILGKVVWKNPSYCDFQAYIFTDKKSNKIGFIRIPAYDGQEYSISEYRKIIEIMESKTSALIIDQCDNPGGSVLYCYALLANLSKKPLAVTLDRCMLMQKDIMAAVNTINTFASFNLHDARIKKALENELYGFSASNFISNYIEYCHALIHEWELGHILTDPLPLMGIKEIAPHRIQYTKPILFLVNECSISCGDSVPAILQDNKRATLMGMKTAGAGGAVLNYNFPNVFGIKNISYTSSIGYRSGDIPLENLGVTPDIIYEKKPEDIQNNNVCFSQRILEEVDKLIGDSNNQGSESWWNWWWN